MIVFGLTFDPEISLKHVYKHGYCFWLLSGLSAYRFLIYFIYFQLQLLSLSCHCSLLVPYSVCCPLSVLFFFLLGPLLIIYFLCSICSIPSQFSYLTFLLPQIFVSCSSIPCHVLGFFLPLCTHLYRYFILAPMSYTLFYLPCTSDFLSYFSADTAASLRSQCYQHSIFYSISCNIWCI